MQKRIRCCLGLWSIASYYISLILATLPVVVVYLALAKEHVFRLCFTAAAGGVV